VVNVLLLTVMVYQLFRFKETSHTS